MSSGERHCSDGREAYPERFSLVPRSHKFSLQPHFLLIKQLTSRRSLTGKAESRASSKTTARDSAFSVKKELLNVCFTKSQFSYVSATEPSDHVKIPRVSVNGRGGCFFASTSLMSMPSPGPRGSSAYPSEYLMCTPP